VVKTARLAREVFITEFDAYPLSPHYGNAWNLGNPVDEFRFEGRPSDDVVVIYRRQWGAETDLDRFAGETFAGNLAADKEPSAPLTVDASESEQLLDAEFWPIIDMLGGKMWEKNIAQVSTYLSGRPDEFILSFAQAAAHKMWELDSPAICKPATGTDGVDYLDGRSSNHLRGAAIAAGRETFEAARDVPTSMLELQLSDMSWAVRFIADDAWRKKHGYAFLTTTWDGHPGSNRTLWDSEARPVIGTGERWDPWTEEDESESQLRLRKIYAESGIPSERPHYREDGIWWTSRILILRAGTVEECLLLSIVLNGEDGWEVTAAACEMVADHLGGAIVGPIERHDLHTRHLQGGAMFAVRRRSSLPLDAYLRTYVPESS
jgi:hypothetical protein